MTILGTILTAAAAVLLAGSGPAQERAGREASPFLPLRDEPPPKLFVDPPLPEPLARGAVIIPYRTENFRILPVFGSGALSVSPRAGHLHVTVDDLPWRWADAGDTGGLVVVGLPPGPHSVRIELSTPEHRVIAGETVRFLVPVPSAPAP